MNENKCQSGVVRKKNGPFISKRKSEWISRVVDSNKKRKKVNVNENRPNLSVLYGRRVVELDTLAEDLWCKNCDIPLSLRDTVAETHHCLASVLEIICRKCRNKLKVYTCRRQASPTENNHYPVNGKAVFGMYDIGIGPCKLNDFLSAINIPPLKPCQMKKYEEELAKTIDACAKDSFKNAIEQEKLARMEAAKSSTPVIEDTSEVHNQNSHFHDENNNEPIGLIASFDAGWQKRGSGFRRNSLSGHASLFGYHTGLLLGVDTKSKTCSKCTSKSSTDHVCSKYWSGSSKAMEPAMAVNLVVNNPLLQEASAKISGLIADDDATTISNIRKNISWPIEKWSDINHVKKNMTSQMYSLKLSSNIIKYFSRRLMLILQSNKNNPQTIRRLLLTAVDHAYGCHENCDNWCGYIQDPEGYKYNNLPGKKPLTEMGRKAPLVDIFKKLANNAEQIAPCGSTHRNESFNHTVAVSHPKNLFFASTVSFTSRVNIAALKTNEKSKYLLKLNEKRGYSPGRYTTQYRLAKDEIAKTRSKKLNDPYERRKRNERRKERIRADCAAQNREGITYQSGCAQFDFSRLLQDINDLEESPTSGEEILVAFDLETSSVSVDTTEICQISAACNEKEIFNRYIVPRFGISQSASFVTGLTVQNGALYLQDTVMETVPLKEALEDFLNFLESVGDKKKVILVAHCGFRFDYHIIINHLQQHGLLERFIRLVPGVADSWLVLRNNFPDRVKEKKSFALSNLIEEYVGSEAAVDAHNAVVDVKNLLAIIAILKLPPLLRNAVKTIKSFIKDREEQALKKEIKENLEPIRISKLMKNRLAEARIDFSILLKVFEENGEEGIKFLLSEAVNSKPRVTKNRRVIHQIINDLKLYKNNTSEKNSNEISNNSRCNLNSDNEDSEIENNAETVINDNIDIYEYYIREIEGTNEELYEGETDEIVENDETDEIVNNDNIDFCNDYEYLEEI